MKTREKCEVDGCNKLSSFAGHYKTKEGLKPYWRKRCQKHHLLGNSGNLSNAKTKNSGNLSISKVKEPWDYQKFLEKKRLEDEAKIARVQANVKKWAKDESGEILD